MNRLKNNINISINNSINDNINEKEYIQEKRDFKNFFFDKEFKYLILGLIFGILICCIFSTIIIIYDIFLLLIK